MTASSLTPPLRFRFGLRTLFVVTAVVCVSVAWVVNSLKWIRERNVMRGKADAAVGYPCRVRVKSPPRAPGGLWLLGEAGTRELWVRDIDAERATRLFPEAAIIPVT